MSVKATINGTVWEFSTAAEAVEFQRAMNPATGASPSVPSAPLPPKRRQRAASGRRRQAGPIPAPTLTRVHALATGELSKGTREVLEMVRRMPSDGLTSEQFAQAIGSPSTEALPIRMMRIGKELLPMNLKIEDVIARKKTYVKSRAVSVYKPGPKLDEVLRGQDGGLFAAAR